MLRAFAFVLLLLPLAPSTAAFCVPFRFVLSGAFRKCCSLERRGLPQSFVRPFYKQAIDELLDYVKSNYAPSTALNDTCLPRKRVHSIRDKLKLAALTKAIHATYMKEHRVFFLPYDKYTDRQIGMKQESVRVVMELIWNNVSKQLSRPLHQVKNSMLYALPDVLTFFFDPNEKGNKEAFTLYEKGNADMMAAPKLVTGVLKLITQLEAAQVAREHSVQLLKHCVALVFSACRAYRREGDDLLLPSFFMALYNEAVRMSTKGRMRVSELPQIPLWLIKKHLKVEIQRISSFETFGALRYASASMECVVSVHDVEKQVFQKVSLIMEEWKKSARTISMRGLNGAVDVAGLCGKGAFYYKVKKAATALDNCCISICEVTELLHRIGMASTGDCCRGCSVAKCALDSTSQLSRVSTVHVQSYGNSPAGAIAIAL